MTKIKESFLKGTQHVTAINTRGMGLFEFSELLERKLQGGWNHDGQTPHDIQVIYVARVTNGWEAMLSYRVGGIQ